MNAYFSGPPRTREPFTRIAAHHGFTIVGDVREAALGVFDVSTFAAPVYHELGIALAMQRRVLLIADAGTEPPLHLGRRTYLYDPYDRDLDGFLHAHLHEAAHLDVPIAEPRNVLDLNGLDAAICLELGIADARGLQTTLFADEEAIARLPRDFPAAVGRVTSGAATPPYRPASAR